MEFPTELDEFLLCCVDEIGQDWEQISVEFLEVAASLDQELQEKALIAFSPAGLEARYQTLASTNGAGFVAPAIPPVTAAEESIAFQAPGRTGETGRGDIGPDAAGPLPSNFSIFNTQNASMLSAYETLKDRLPSADFHAEGESGSDSGHDELGHVDPKLMEKTNDIFGTSNLDKIFPPVIIGAEPNGVSGIFPSFDATLLSFGVNPKDIEGPLIDVPQEMRPAFDFLRTGNTACNVPRPEAMSPQKKELQQAQVIPSMERKSTNVTLYKGIPVHDENEEESQGDTSGADDFLFARNKMRSASEIALFKAMNEGTTLPAKPFDPPLRRPKKPKIVKTKVKAPPSRPSVEQFIAIPLEETSSVSSEDDCTQEQGETEDREDAVADAAEERTSFPPIPGPMDMEKYDAEELEDFKRQTEQRRQKLSSRLDQVGLLPRKEALQKAMEKMYPGQADYSGPGSDASRPAPKPATVEIPGLARRPETPVQERRGLEATLSTVESTLPEREEPQPVGQEQTENPLKEYLSGFYPIVHKRITFTPHIPSLPIKETKTAIFPWPQNFPTDDTVTSLSGLLQVAKGAQLCCEKDYIALAFEADEDLSIYQPHGLQCTPTSVFTQPLAFNAYEWGTHQQDTLTGDTCAIVVKELTAVRPLLSETYSKGLYLAGMRSLYPTKDNIGTSAHSHVIPHRRNLILAFRGPHCFEILRDLIGPNCPKLASKTDPASLNASFQTVVASPPMRSQADLAWAFGGRLPLLRESSTRTPVTSALGIFPVQPIAFAICARMRWKETLDIIRRFVDFGGSITAINSLEQRHETLGSSRSVMQIHALREGGMRFTDGLNLPGIMLKPSPNLGLHIRRPPEDKPWPIMTMEKMASSSYVSHAHQFMPEMCIICLTLLAGQKESLHEVFEHLPNVDTKIFAGRRLEMTSIRVVDMERLRQVSPGYPWCFSSTSSNTVVPNTGLVAMVAIRGYNAIERCRGWCERDCRSVVAGASSRLLYVTKTMDEAFDVYHTFFFKNESFPILLGDNTIPTAALAEGLSGAAADGAGAAGGFEDIYSISRFHTQLFPSNLEQKAVAFIFPPLIANVSRALRCLEHNEFSLVAAARLQILSDEEKALLLEQEMRDGFLFPGEEEAVDKPCVRLVVQRVSAVHKLTELLAHGDPKENAKQCRFSLRRGDRVNCHVRCTSRLDTASAMINSIDPFIIDRSIRYGVKATIEESLIALAATIFEKLDEKAELISLSARKEEPTSSFFAAFDRPHMNITREGVGAHTLEVFA